MSTARSAPGGARLLDRLRDDGRITAPQYESFYHQAKRTGVRIEEAILQSGAVPEAELLKLAASLYKTRFVTTERLARADIDRATLDRVPRKLAERLTVMPILFDARTQTLSVVACDLEDDPGKQIQVLGTAREVQVLVARPAAVLAAIRRFYGGDPRAFAGLFAPPPSYAGALDVVEHGHRGPSDGIEIDLGLPPGPVAPAAPAPAAVRPASSPPRALPAAPPVVAPARGRAPAELRIEMPVVEAPAPPAPPAADLLETVTVLVTLIDAGRAELRGHSALVARITRKLLDRLGVPPSERDAILLAAYLHDVGKTSAYHLTAFNVSRFEGHRLQAERTYLAPVRMFERAKLPETTIVTLTHLFERVDGQGFPQRLGGKDIPLGARVVSAVETLADLTTNPKNPYRRILRPAEATDVVRQLGGTLFDPHLADLLHQALHGEERKADANQRRVLVVDPDGEEAAVLELRLAEAGHDVVVARDRAEAEAAVGRGEVHLVLSELELGEGGGGDGFALLAALRAQPSTSEVPFVFLTRKADRASVARGFELGAADFVVKPASPELVAAKASQLIEQGPKKRSTGGLSGSLRDMALPEVIQALGNGRKTGMLRLRAAGGAGELHFLDGAIADASFGAKSGEDAVYAMLAQKDGDFSLDPSFRPARRAIQASTEALLLEGMRRIDEGLV